MSSRHVEGAEAAEGLRTAVGFYARKTQRLRERQTELQAELEALQAELARASTARDQLGQALREIIGEEAIPDTPDHERGQAPTPSEVEAAADTPTPTGSKTASLRITRPRQSTGSAKPGHRNVELWREVLQVLATSGRPMRVKEIAAALGRPTKGKAGTSAVETVRSTCKRQVKHGRAVEGPAGVFEIARGQEAVLKGGA